MLTHLRPAIVLIVLFTLLTGVAFPLAMTGIGGVVFPFQAGGSLIEKDGKVIGSALIGQNFTDPKYFQSRPSAITAPDPKDPSKTIDTPYDASNSNASNLAPTVPGTSRRRSPAGWRSISIRRWRSRTWSASHA
jgi:K+-transporting ATPase ATPase C chain